MKGKLKGAIVLASPPVADPAAAGALSLPDSKRRPPIRRAAVLAPPVLSELPFRDRLNAFQPRHFFDQFREPGRFQLGMLIHKRLNRTLPSVNTA